jgi:hypothetical protein
VNRVRAAIAASLTGNAIWVWVAFVLVHLWLGYLNLYGPNQPMGDVSNVYRYWVARGVYADVWVGIDVEWVYPILAIVPMIAAWAFGEGQYSSTWLSMVFVLDIAAFGVLTGWGRAAARIGIAWWWVAFLVLLGPIALGRIDSITVPLAVMAVVIVSRRPVVAAVLLAVATWIKIWPAALIGSLLIASQRRGTVLIAGLATSIAIVGVALSLGAGSNIASFVSQQTGRGLQIEAPISTIWMWLTALHVPGTQVYYDTKILTFQVVGPGSQGASELMNPILVLVVAGVAALGIRAARRGATALELLAPVSLALVLALIVFNKVGSPQFEMWLVAPVILGLLAAQKGAKSFVIPALIVLIIAGLTQAVYPYLYSMLLSTQLPMLIVISARNILLIMLFGWAVNHVYRSGAPFAVHADDTDVSRVEAEHMHDALPWLGTTTIAALDHATHPEHQETTEASPQ